ncbi:MAG: M61 family metallopeptidase [Terriglobales bacterium]
MKHLRRKTLLICCLILCAAASGQVPPKYSLPEPGGLRYTVTFANTANHLLHVQIEVPRGFSRELQLPVWNALYQVRDFSQHVQHTSAHERSHNPLPITAVDKTTWRVGGEDSFTFEYDIVADNPGPFGAEVNEQHAFLNLAEVCVYVVGAKDRSLSVSFTGFPPNWKIATPLMDHAVKMTGAAAIELQARNYDRLVDSPVEFGEFDEIEIEDAGVQYRIVVDANTADYDLRAIAAMDRKLAATEIEWMQDRPIDHYLFIYHFPRRPTGGGMEHAYSTAISAPAERVKNDPLSLADVTAHEFFHLWNVKRIRPQSLEPVDYTKEQYTRALWFSEGVTSTVADYMRVRAGYLDQNGFLTELANDIRVLESRPARLTQSVEESSLDAWLEKYPPYDLPERSISYYNKGEILGMLLDLEMRESNAGKKSLRDLFLWMNQRYAKQGKFFPDSRGVQEAAEAVTGRDFGHFFTRYVTGVDPIPYNRFFATVGLRLDKQTITVPDPGFRTQRRQSAVAIVVVVNPGGEAEKAGLRAGDVIQQVNGQPASAVPENDVARLRIGDTVDLRVSAAAGPRKIKFKLAGAPVENYSIAERDDVTPAQRARRAAWIRGDSE